MTDILELKAKLAKLQLKAMASSLDTVLAEAKTKNHSIVTAISYLAELELERRRQNAIKLRWDQSKLPDKPTIDQFDFEHHKSRKDHKNRILHLMDLEFIKERMDSDIHFT